MHERSFGAAEKLRKIAKSHANGMPKSRLNTTQDISLHQLHAFVASTAHYSISCMHVWHSDGDETPTEWKKAFTENASELLHFAQTHRQ